MIDHLLSRYQNWIWNRDLHGAPWHERFCFEALRIVTATAHQLIVEQLTLQAKALVFATLLSVVPLLAFALAVLAAFGAHDIIRPLLERFLAPLGPNATSLIDQILTFVSHVKVGVLGSVGLVLLVYTIVVLIQEMENNFNLIWHVKQPRSWGRRFSDYLSMLIIGPMLVIGGVGASTTINNSVAVQTLLGIQPFGVVLYGLGQIAQYCLISAIFTLLYLFVPNTRVRVSAAAIGGLSAGILWQTANLAFATFVATSSSYNAIYSSFAIVILLLIWLYVSFLILLSGAQIAFYRQHPQYLMRNDAKPHPSARLIEQLTLTVMCLVGRRHLQGRRGWNEEELARYLLIHPDPVSRVVDALVEADLLVRTDASQAAPLLPARDLEAVTVAAVLRAVRAGDTSLRIGRRRSAALRAADMALQDVETAIATHLENLTVRELLQRQAACGEDDG